MSRRPAAAAAGLLLLPLLTWGCAGTQIDTTKGADMPAHAMSAAEPPVAVPTARLRDLRPGQRPPPDSDEAGLWLLMDKLEAHIRTAPHRLRDAALTRYVRGVACRVAGPHCRDIRIYILRRAAFNATMGPNGALVVWSGALTRFRNEAQLAAVLGHEIAHYVRRHSLQRLRDVSGKTGLVGAVSMTSIIAGVPLAGDVAQLAALGAIFSFSRDNEREADEIGARLMARAGYDPREAAAVWRQLLEERKADEDRDTPMVFFATHPPAEERLETLARLGDRLARNPDARRRSAQPYRRAVVPVLAALLRDELRRRRLARFSIVLKGLASAGAPEGIIKFFEGEVLRFKGGDPERAVAAYRAALAAGGAPPETRRALGIMLLRQGAREAARDAFAAYLRRNPGAADAELVRSLMAERS